MTAEITNEVLARIGWDAFVRTRAPSLSPKAMPYPSWYDLPRAYREGWIAAAAAIAAAVHPITEPKP